MKKNTLYYLEKASGGFISGAYIAKELGVSRMAVSKAVAELKKEGAIIEASTKSGYRLLRSTDALYAESVKAHLNCKIAQIYCHSTLASTNEEAKKLAAAGAEHATLITADEQSAGRGRRGRDFFSPMGTGIYMSVIIRPSVYRPDVHYTVAAAVAARRVIDRISEDRAEIKWVNDIYISGRKVCGILCEAVSELESGELSAVICGIGINLTPPKNDFPDELKNKAGYVTKNEISKAKVIAELTHELLSILEERNENIISEYSDNMMLTGKEVYYTLYNEQLSGVAVGVDESGGLIVRSQSGELSVLRSGEVSLEKF